MKMLFKILIVFFIWFDVTGQVPSLDLKKELPEKTLVCKITINDKLIVIGNKFYAITQPYDPQFTQDRRLYEFDMINNSWTRKADMPVRKNGFSIQSVNGKIYTIGGSVASGKSNSLEMYDPSTNQWTTKKSMESSRDCAGSIALDNKIYMFGGSQPAGKPSAEVYNTLTDSWTSLADMPTVNTSWSTVVELKGIIYVIGAYSGIFEAYDTAKNTWSKKSRSIPGGAVDSIPGGPLVATAVGESIYLFCFADGKEKITAQYNPVTDQWTRKKNMISSRGDCNLSVINNEIYLIGGTIGPGASQGLLKTIDRYSPATDTWTTVANLSYPKWYTAVASTGSKFFVVGGYYSGGSDDKVEMYDPTINLISAMHMNQSYELQNLPNPFSDCTSIKFELNTPQFCTLRIYDVNGRLIETLLHEKMVSGEHQVKWSPKGLAKGIYYYQLKAEDRVETSQLLFIK